MINVSSTVFVPPTKTLVANTDEGGTETIILPKSANLDLVIVENLSLDSSEEYELPTQYTSCGVIFGEFSYDGNVFNANTAALRPSSGATKINISANSKIIILSRQT